MKVSTEGINTCPACYSHNISRQKVAFYRLIYYLDATFQRFKILFGYKCNGCGYYINENHKDIMLTELFTVKS